MGGSPHRAHLIKKPEVKRGSAVTARKGFIVGGGGGGCGDGSGCFVSL